MATVRQYVTALQQRQVAVGRLLGVYLPGMGEKELRALNLSLLAMIGTLAKVLVDKGVTTDAELVAVLEGTLQDNWPSEPLDPPKT